MNLEKIIFGLRQHKWGILLLHLTLWGFYFGAILYLDSISFNSSRGTAILLTPLRYTIGTIFSFYILFYWIWPYFLSKKKYWIGALLIVALIILYAVLDHLLERLIIYNCDVCMAEMKASRNGYYGLFQRGALNVVLVRLITFGIVYQWFVFLAFPVVIKVFFELLDQRVNTLKLQRENVQLEFNFLKAQVNPHFLFNTLNNIYALILSDKKEQSAETVSRLATFMRYTLYETNTERSPVVKELDLLKAYISLEQIRLNDVTVNCTISTDHTRYLLPPLLFIPAVENAFKYCSVNVTGNAFIFLRFEIEANELLFRITNTYDSEKMDNSTHGGIGLENLQRRLQHYYPEEKSSFEIEDNGEMFTLTIELKLEA